MSKLKQVCSVAAYDFRWWHKNPRIFITFALAFILCFLLSDKAVKFAAEYGTTMQIVEAFIWTFDDGNSILLSSLLLVLLFADMPFLSRDTVLSRSYRPQNMDYRPGSIYNIRNVHLYGFYPRIYIVPVYEQLLHGKHVEQDGGNARLFRCREEYFHTCLC